jgi:hypothetical protein
MFKASANVYIFGPVTGFREKNKKLFSQVAKLFRSKGYRVSTPEDRQAMVPIASRMQTTESLLARNYPWINASDMGVVLPGWRDSELASLEALVLLSTGRIVVEVDHDMNIKNLDKSSGPQIIHNDTQPKGYGSNVKKDAQGSGGIA